MVCTSLSASSVPHRSPNVSSGHLAIRIYNQKAAAALAGRLYKPLMKRIRGVAAHPFPQRGGKVPGLRGMGADRVGKQRVAD